MHILFVDGTLLGYTPLTPAERPLGGMQSALCYLSKALAARGHSVSLLNRGNPSPGTYGGVACAGFESLNGATLNNFDVVVSISTGSITFRELGLSRPLVLWTGHDIDQAAVERLGDGNERYLWDKIVLVSEWQTERFCRTFKLGRDRIAILRNAVAPAFERLSRHQPYFFESGRPPVFYYSSTPFRGLDILLAAFPLIRRRIPGSEARIYSSMAVYQQLKERDSYRPLYDRCRTTEGVLYVGSLGQVALAQAMTNLDVLSYPSTFQETSCISVMEAMAGGCMVLSVARGALPETAAGFGNFCDHPTNISPAQFAELYARFVLQKVEDAYRNPQEFSSRIDCQRSFAQTNYSWASRAVEWEIMLLSVLDQPPRTMPPRGNEPCPCQSGRRFERCCGTVIKPPTVFQPFR
jgi:glycosyltransferase involved in cell wall biosynthesis